MDKPDLVKTLAFYGVEVNEHRVTQLVRCPVHQEDRASCSINLVKGLYSCKACGSAGDSLTLIKTKEGLGSFAAVVQFAATQLGVVPSVPAGGGRPGLRGESRPGRGGFKPKTRRGSLRPREG